MVLAVEVPISRKLAERIEAKKFVLVAEVTVRLLVLKLVLVALVIVARVPVRLPIVPFVLLKRDAKRVVAVAKVMVATGAVSPPNAVSAPPKKLLPPTASVADGEVVAIPRDPPAVKTEESAPPVLYISMMLAVCPPAGLSARVVEAFEVETTESFAYGVEVPSPTLSDEVARVTEPMLLVVHPPPVDAPPTETVPQETRPFASVLSACPPEQEITGMLSVLVNLPFTAVN